MVKDKRIDKRGHIEVDSHGRGYETGYAVLYKDKNGVSILARSKDRLKAFKIAERFNKKLYSGKLLKEDKSAFGGVF